MLYVDTSALIKLYVDEKSSDVVVDAVRHADRTFVSLIAYAESRAAFARLKRQSSLTPKAYADIVDIFEADWPRFTSVNVSERLIRRAGDFAETHGLRGFDAVHLASAIEALHDDAERTFACFDAHLSRAAKREKFRVIGA